MIIKSQKKKKKDRFCVCVSGLSRTQYLWLHNFSKGESFSINLKSNMKVGRTPVLKLDLDLNSSAGTHTGSMKCTYCESVSSPEVLKVVSTLHDCHEARCDTCKVPEQPANGTPPRLMYIYFR